MKYCMILVVFTVVNEWLASIYKSYSKEVTNNSTNMSTDDDEQTYCISKMKQEPRTIDKTKIIVKTEKMVIFAI